MKNPHITFDYNWPFASTDSTLHRLKSIFLSAVGNLWLGMRKYCFHLLLVESSHVKPMDRKDQLFIERDPPARGPAQFKSVLFEGQLYTLFSKIHCPLFVSKEFKYVQVSTTCGKNSCRSRLLQATRR